MTQIVLELAKANGRIKGFKPIDNDQKGKIEAQ